MRQSENTHKSQARPKRTSTAADLAQGAAQRFQLQPLEERLLFSANTGTATDNTIGAGTAAAINAGLAEVVKFAAELDGFGEIGASISGVGESLGDLFDLGTADGKGGFLGAEIAQPLDQFLKNGGVSASSVSTFLQGLAVGKNSAFDSITVENVTGGYYSATDEYEWELTVKGVKTSSFALDPGADMGTEGLSFDAGVTLDIAADVAITFSFGAKADGTGFFLTFSDLDLGASADTGKTLNFGVDFASGGSLGVKDGQVQISARVSDLTLSVTEGANGRIGSKGLAELNDGLSATEITYSEASASLHAELPLDAIATGFPTVFIDSDDVFSGTAPDVSVKYFLTDATLQSQILSLLGAMDSAVSGITNNALLSQTIPIINKSLSELLPDADFETFFSFQDVASDYFASTAEPELPGLVAELQEHFSSLVSVASAGIEGAFSALSRQVEFGINLEANPSLDLDVPLDRFGDAAVEMGLKVPDNLTVNVTGSAKADFVLGVDLTDLSLTADDFYLKINELSASASVSAKGLDFGLNIGPLSAGVEDGTIDLSAKASVSFVDPNNDGRIAISEITSSGVEITPTGNVDVKLPLVVGFGGYDFKVGTESPYLRFYSENPFTERVKVDATTPNFSRLFNLGKMGPEQVLDLMIAAGDFAEQFRDAAVFDIQIPFLNNVDLGNAFDFGLLFAKNLRDRLSINEVSLFSGLTSLNLTTDTPFVISIDGDATNSKRVVLSKGDYATPSDLAAGLNAAIQAVYGATPPVTAVIDNGSDRKAGTADDRVKLVSDPGAVPSFGVVGTLAGLADLGFYSGSTIAKLTTATGANANGQLTADASFAISIDGGAPISITLSKAVTSDNKNVVDLAKDVDAAIKTAGIDSVAVSESSGKLVFTGASGVEAFVIAGVGNTAWNELGLLNSNVAGMSSVGSIEKTGPAFSSFQELVPLLASALGIPENIISPSYDPNTETIKLHVEFGYNPTPLQVPVSFNLNLGDLVGVSTVDASGKTAPTYITLTPKLNAKLDFGYSFRPTIIQEELSVAPSFGYVSPAGYDQNASTLTPLTWNGRLSSDAHFTVILDNAIPIALTIPSASTTGNTSVADLVADINTAIANTPGLNGKIQAKVIPASGETAERVQIATVAGASRSLQIKTTSSDSSATELGFAPDSFAQASNQTIAVAGLTDKKAVYAPGADATFYVSIDGGAVTPITIPKSATDGNTTFGDLLLDINAAIKDAGLDGRLIATRFGAGDRIQLSTLGNTRTLRFDTEPTDAAATKLGFSSDEVFLRQRGGGFFIENAEIAASARLAVEDLRLAAQIGFIGINTGDSGGEINLGLAVQLKDTKDNTRFEIGDLFGSLVKGGITNMVKVTPSGNANFSLSNITVSAGMFTVPGSPTIGFVISDLFPSGPLTVTPVFENMPSLTNFKKLNFATIFNAVKQGVAVLSNYEQFGFLNNKIPVINLSAVEILDYADKLRTAIEELQDNPASALQFVEAKIEEFLGLPPNFVNLSVEGPNLDVVKLSFTLEKSYNNSFALDLDLADLGSLFDGGLPAGLQTISSLIDASAEGDLELAAFAEAKLELGIDLSAPTSPKTFLYDTSGLTFGVRLAGRNLNFNANIGIVGLAVTDGTVLLDSDGKFDVYDKDGNFVEGGDGVIDDDYATFRIGLKDNAEPGSPNDGRHYFTESFTFADDFSVAFAGQFVTNLPAAVITPLGNIDLDQAITLATSAADFPNLIQRVAGSFPLKITAPNIKDLLPEVPGIIQLLRDPSILLDGVDSALFKIQSALDSQTSQKLPLLGDRLAEGAQVIEDFREGFLASLTEKLRGAGDNLLNDLQQVMFSFFHDDLGLLQDYNGDNVLTPDDIVLTFRKADGTLWEEGVDAPKDQDAVQFGFHLGDSYTADIPDLSIDFSLPGLALDINGSPSVELSWDLYFGFGVSVSDLFFVDTKPTTDGLPKHDGNDYVENELEVNFDVKLTSNEANPFTATGQLFFLQLQAKDTKLNADNTDPSGSGGKFSYFNGKFAVDISDPGVGDAQDGRLTFPELFKKSKDPVIKASLSAVADINLRLDLSVQGSKVMPRILADFNLDWSWSLSGGSESPKVGFNNVKLDLGSFISDFLGPIAQKIDEAIKPFDPVLDALQTRIPVLSDLMGRDYTLLDLAATFGKVDRRFVDAVIQVRGLIADIAAAAASGESILIDIGSIADFGSAVMKKGSMGQVDPSSLGISTANLSVPAAAKPETKTVMSKASSVTGGGFAFPILKPSNVFKLLMGQDVVLFTYDIPRLEVSMSMSTKFSIFGPLVATFGGKISAYADLAVGFDTKGLNQFKTSGDVLDILDGFYVSDRANPDGTGADVPEAGFLGRIDIGGAVNLAVVEAGINGFFQITADLDLNDPNDDGKIRGSEIISLLKYQAPDGNYYGPLNLGSITLKGEVGARAYVDVLALFSWVNVWEYEFFRATIFEKTFSAPRPQPALAQVSSGGVLSLNAGTGANGRVFGSTTDVGEDFTLVSLPDGRVEVTFNNTGTKQVYSGVGSVEINAGKGNDRIDASKLKVPVKLWGGEGDDVLIAGSAGSYLDGGSGNDELIGGIGIDTIIGGTGADTLDGGDGDDILEGGDGRDEIKGGTGHDTYRFGNNWGADVLELLGSNDPSNLDTLDFGAATDALTISIGSNLSKITAGKNSLSAQDSVGEIQLIKAGAGSDTVNINASSPGGISVDGGKGSDTFVVGFGRLNGAVNILDTNGAPTDMDTIVVTPLGSDPIGVYDNKLTSTKGGGALNGMSVTANAGSGLELVNYDGGIENLTIDGSKNIVTVEEALDLAGSVRLKALTAVIPNPVSANYIRVDSVNTVEIAGDLNSRVNGNIEVVVGKGDLEINANVFSSASTKGVKGNGSGVVQLISRGGEITADGSGVVRADNGYLLLLGTTGSIGTQEQPILTQVKTLAANTTGTGMVNIQEEDGLIVEEVAIIKGVTSNGGEITITNLTNELRFQQPANAKGGDMTFTTDQIQINADLTSATGDLQLQPVKATTSIGLGDGTSATFNMETSEISHLVDGFNTVTIGRDDGSHPIYIEDITLQDPTFLQNPILGGRIYQTGQISSTSSVTVIGSGHTIELDTQLVAAGSINILDSAVVREGESVRLDAAAGNVNINFDVDGTAGGVGETLTLNAPNGIVVIKGNVGSLAKLENLVIENATAVYFEGSVNVGTLTIKNAGTVRIDGAVTADTVSLETAGYVDFRSSVSANVVQSQNGVVGTAVFQGAISASSVNLSATTLLDFYQGVNTTGNVVANTTGLMGDIVFRQQVNSGGTVTVGSNDDITFSGPVAAANVTITSANDLAFQSTATISGTLQQVHGTGSTTLGQVQAGSIDLHAANLTLGATVTATTGGVALEAAADGTILAAGSITANSGALTINQTGSVTFSARVDVKSASVTASQFITVATTAAFATAGDVSLTTTDSAVGEIRLTGPFAVGGNATVSSARAVSFLGTLGVAGELNISKASSVQYQSLVDVGGKFIQSSQVSGAASFAANVRAGAMDLQAGSLAFAGDVLSSGESTLRANAGAISVAGAFSSTGALAVTKATMLSFGGSVAASAADLTVSDTITVGVGGISTTSGVVKLTTLNAGVGNSVTVNGVVAASGDLVISTPRGVALNSTVNAANGSITAASLSTANQLSFSGSATLNLTSDFVAAADVSTGGALIIPQVRDVSFGGVVSAASITIGTQAARNITTSAAGMVSTGDISLTSTVAGAAINLNGPVTSSAGALSITAAGKVTAVAAVSGISVTGTAATLTFSSNVISTSADIVLAATGNVSIAGAVNAAHSLRIDQALDAAIQGAITAQDIQVTAAGFMAGNTVTTSQGSFVVSTTGNVRVVGLTIVANDLVVTAAANVTFEGQVLVTGALLQSSGSGTTRFEGVTQAASIDLKAAQQIYAGNVFRAVSGDIVLQSDEIDFTGGTNTVQGAARLVLRPASAGTTIDVGSPTPSGTLDLSDVDLTALRDGFTKIVIGREEDGAGALVLGSSIFKDNVSFHAGNITVAANSVPGQQVISLESIEMTARLGDIAVHDDVVAADVTLRARDGVNINNRVEGRAFITVTAGMDETGGINLTSEGVLATTAAGSDIAVIAGTGAGDITIAGKIVAPDDVTLTATAGVIEQTAGNISAVDLFTTAKNGINLLTTVDHVSAKVTGTGDLTLTDINSNPLHFINLGSETDVNDGLFTADGKITVNSNANANALRVESSGGVFLNIAGDVFARKITGSPSVITGTVLLDEDRTTFGEDIVFAGNVRLLRDITLASNGGNIVITGYVTSTAGEQFGLTLDATGGNVSIGGAIGAGIAGAVPLEYLKVVNTDGVSFGTSGQNSGAIRVTGNIEINANTVEFNSAAGSIQTTGGGELILRPLSSGAAIDIGSPSGGNASFSINDNEIRAFGDGFSLITIGQSGGAHDVKIESAQFRDSLIVHGATVNLLTSATPQGVTGLSVVNGNDDNSITINATNRFTQGSRAAINAGRYGDIVITADQIEFDTNNRNLVRGFGDLVLQPASAAQSITIGTAGAGDDFDLTVAELGAIADGFQSITIGRSNGEHAIVIDSSLQFRDSITIQAPVGAGSITVGNGTTLTLLKLVGKGDSLKLIAGNNVALDSSLSTTGGGAIQVTADADKSGQGDLSIGQNVVAKKAQLLLATQNGDIRLSGENVRIGKADAKLGAVQMISRLGNVQVIANGNADNTGEIAFAHSKSSITTGGQVIVGSPTMAAQTVTIGGIKITAQKGFTLQARGNATIMSGTKLIAKAGPIQLIADRDNAADDGNSGLLSIESSVLVSSTQSILLSAFSVDRNGAATIKAPEVTTDEG